MSISKMNEIMIETDDSICRRFDQLKADREQSFAGLGSLLSFGLFVRDFLSLAELYEESWSDSFRDKMLIRFKYSSLCYHYSRSPVGARNINSVAEASIRNLLFDLHKLVDSRLFSESSGFHLIVDWLIEVIRLTKDLALHTGSSRPDKELKSACRIIIANIFIILFKLARSKIPRYEHNHETFSRAELETLVKFIKCNLSSRESRELHLKTLDLIDHLSSSIIDETYKVAVGIGACGFLAQEFVKLSRAEIRKLLISIVGKESERESKLKIMAVSSKLAHSESSFNFFGKIWRRDPSVESSAADLIILQTLVLSRDKSEVARHTRLLWTVLSYHLRRNDPISLVEALNFASILVEKKLLDLCRIASLETCLINIVSEVALDQSVEDVHAIRCGLLRVILKFEHLDAHEGSLFGKVGSLLKGILNQDTSRQTMIIATSTIQTYPFENGELGFECVEIVADSLIKDLQFEGEENWSSIRDRLNFIQECIEYDVFWNQRLSDLVQAIIDYCERTKGQKVNLHLFNLLKISKEVLNPIEFLRLWPLAFAVIGHFCPKTAISCCDIIAKVIELSRNNLDELSGEIGIIEKIISLPKVGRDPSPKMLDLMKTMLLYCNDRQTLHQRLCTWMEDIPLIRNKGCKATKSEFRLLDSIFIAIYKDPLEFWGHLKEYSMHKRKNTTNILEKFMSRWFNERSEIGKSLFSHRIRVLAISKLLIKSTRKQAMINQEETKQVFPLLLKWLKSLKEQYERDVIECKWARVFGGFLNADQKQFSETKDCKLAALEDEFMLVQRMIAHCRADEVWYSELKSSLSSSQKSTIESIISFNYDNSYDNSPASLIEQAGND